MATNSQSVGPTDLGSYREGLMLGNRSAYLARLKILRTIKSQHNLAKRTNRHRLTQSEGWDCAIRCMTLGGLL
jgi:hypothetical protein